MHVGEQRTGAEQFAQAAEHHQNQTEADAHDQTVEACDQWIVFGGEPVGASKDDAVGGDQRDEDAEDLVQLVGEGLHQQLDAGGQRGDDHHERRQAHRGVDHASHQRDTDIRTGQYQHGRQAKAEGVDRRVADAEQRAETEQLHQRWIVLPQAVDGQFAVAGCAHG